MRKPNPNSQAMSSSVAEADQPVHPPSVVRVLVYSSLNRPEAVAGTFNQQTDQTVQMRRLILVFAGLIVGFAMIIRILS